MSAAIQDLEDEKAEKLDAGFSTIILDYYITVYKAELTALNSVQNDVLEK